LPARAGSSPRSLGELAAAVAGEVRGDAARAISGVNGLAEAGPGELTFFNNPCYREALAKTRASAVLVTLEGARLLKGPDALVVADPSLAFARISALFHPRPEFAPGVDARAVVEPGAQIDPSATVMAFSFVGRDARIGARAVLFPQVFIGEGSTVGAQALLYPGCVVREGCTVGARVILQPGVVVGADGFGFAWDAAQSEHFKIPQVGTAEVQDDVEIGANSAIDRATLGQTVIGRGSKLDNLVQVGHNVQVGACCILCGQVGIAGSSTLGQGVVCGGQVGVANHVAIVEGTRIAAQSGVKDDVDERGEYIGSPIQLVAEFARSHVAFERGAETMRTVHRLEKRVAELEEKLAALAAGPRTDKP